MKVRGPKTRLAGKHAAFRAAPTGSKDPLGTQTQRAHFPHRQRDRGGQGLLVRAGTGNHAPRARGVETQPGTGSLGYVVAENLDSRVTGFLGG